MAPLEPLYTAENTRLAFQLNWSVTLLLRDQISLINLPCDELSRAVQRDSIRLLEHRRLSAETFQFFVSSLPHVTPADIVRSLKGRCQYLLKAQYPRVFRRNYHVTSVGAANQATLDDYVDRQPWRHPMADSHIQARVLDWQYHDPTIDLTGPRRGAHGTYLHNLHLVTELERGAWCLDSQVWTRRRTMLINMTRRKRWSLSRIGIVANHLHLLLGCGLLDSPLAVGLSTLNNLAFVDGMQPNYRFGFYVGTFGSYNRAAIRRQLPGNW